MVRSLAGDRLFSQRAVASDGEHGLVGRLAAVEHDAGELRSVGIAPACGGLVVGRRQRQMGLEVPVEIPHLRHATPRGPTRTWLAGRASGAAIRARRHRPHRSVAPFDCQMGCKHGRFLAQVLRLSTVERYCMHQEPLLTNDSKPIKRGREREQG